MGVEMSSIGKLWAGRLFGTNMGNLFVETSSTNGEFTGTVRFMDDRFGLVIYAITGTFDGTNVQFTGKCTQSPEGVVNGEISARGTLTPEGQLRGQWSSTIGTGGTFILHPHDSSSGNEITPGLLPERMHTATRSIGAIRLYAEDVQELIGFLSKDFNQGRVVVTYRERGSEVSRYASDLQNDLARLGKLRYLKLLIQEPEAYGINRLAIVELNANGTNEIRVQGVQESWVIGKAESVASLLRLHQKTLSTTFRSFGLNIKGLLALGTLVALPELSIGKRIIFVAVVAIIAWLIVQAHTRFIPNVLVYLSPRLPNAIERAWPQLLSWLIAVTSALVASIAYGVLKGELSSIPSWVLNLIH
jgi:hypothetical protein